MTPTIDAVARTPVAAEAPAGISEGAWFRVAASGHGGDVGTVSMTEDSERDALHHQRINDLYHDTVVERLHSLLRLQRGCDSYGSPAISPLAAGAALKFLACLRDNARPSVVPTAKGGAQLEWHNGDDDVEVECFPSGHAHLFAENAATGETEDRWVVPGHPAIDTWLRRLRVRR